jgi:hypothetical protein
MSNLQTLELRQTGGLALKPDEVKARVDHIIGIAKAVMRPDVHYGKIPGTDKPSLLKPGAELLLMTFQLAASYETEPLTEGDEVAYRVTCKIHGPNGQFLGSGQGICSSNETKYKWRKPVCDEEFEDTPKDRRREKWTSYWNKESRRRESFKAKQVRTEPADVENTVLKMAAKRALIAATLQVTAASEVFTQDLEEMPDELRQAILEDESPRGQAPQGNGNSAPAGGSRKRADGKPMQAKFEGKCDICREAIPTGDKIIYFSADKAAAHDRCVLE